MQSYGATPYTDADADETKVQRTTSGGLLTHVSAWNAGAATAYVQIFRGIAAASVTLGTTAPDYVVPVPAGGGAAIDFRPGLKVGLTYTYAVTGSATGSDAPDAAILLNLATV